jgi:DNA-binding MarR family transcriptional regulator
MWLGHTLVPAGVDGVPSSRAALRCVVVRWLVSKPEANDPGSADADLGPTLEFLRLLWALDHRLQTTSKHMLGELGVTGTQRMAVRFIGRFDTISAGELSDLLHLHPSTLTGVLDKLVTAGLVLRSRDPHDARRAQLSLTDAGRTVDRVQRGTVEAAVKRALAQSSELEIDATRTMLRRLRDELDPDGSVSRRPPDQPASGTSRRGGSKR